MTLKHHQNVIARDVALFRFWPPITANASPRKPSLETPSLNDELLPSAEFAGGMSGYGADGIDFTTNKYVFPDYRQSYISNDFKVARLSVGSGLAVWIHTAPFTSGPNVLPGDSGGPLFTLPSPSDHDTRNVIGVDSHVSYGAPNNPFCDATGNLFCGPDTVSSLWADITAPTIKSWILQYVDPNSTGRWEGETDYPRTQFKSFFDDPACHVGDDADCDFVNDYHDNCPGDYNPDQYNFDDGSADHYQALDNSDPGDACDLCWRDPGPIDQPDCNKDAEILKWSQYRQNLTESNVVGSPTAPYGAVSPLLAANRDHYKGDECDNVACTKVATTTSKVPTGIAKPGPFCQGLGKNFECGFGSNSRIQHDGRIVALLSGEMGGTGYRYCPCAGPLDKHPDLRKYCLMGASAPCPWHATAFNSAAVHKLKTVNPSFTALGTTTDQGTTETFTSSPKPTPPSFNWQWWQDYNSIQGTSISFPIPYAAVGSFKLDGVIWSSVRDRPALSQDIQDLESYWHGVHLRLNEGVAPDYIATIVPSQWVYPGCPTCPWGLHLPYLLGPDPAYLPGRVFAGLPGGGIDITSAADPYFAELFDAVGTDPDLTFVPAVENGAYLATLDEDLPTLAALDAKTLQPRGFLTESASGMLTGYSTAPVGEVPARQPGQSTCLAALRTSNAPTEVHASLSATEKSMYLFTGSPGVPSAVLDYDIVTHECTELVGPLPLDTEAGEDPVGQPLGLTYNAVQGSLFAVDRENRERPAPVRVLRIGMDGKVGVLAKIASPWTGRLFLATGQDGELVVASNHKQSKHFRVMLLDVRGKMPRSVARYTGHGSLVAAPMLDERGLYLALAGSPGRPRFVQLARDNLQHPKKSSLAWVFR